ncbi:hypothetical protein L198_07788 [Cryptococcus wingfieldii CBS 7118]|uniref:Uncharacterized protein n=1 Tax=Cryptococcus wingfieldii CBS 7118 TaxID=1295528 RepID=A0A1E3HY95_9TREE|nr:hypothetical protein L198_07788 [Cryptococcus wingfieldii CBS 7118]ODN81302.1 hypothetical protein L198_07788 [Cryptococcus wingfieldii CBS 7118]
MSLNDVKLTRDGQPDIAAYGETFTAGPHAVDMHLVLPPSFGSSDNSNSSSNSKGKGKGKGKKRVLKAEKGKVWVTDYNTNLYSQTYSKVLFAPSNLTLCYLPGQYPESVALFPPLAPTPPDFGQLIEAVMKSKDKGVLMGIKEGVEVGKEESMRGERIGESVRALREEGWGVGTG